MKVTVTVAKPAVQATLTNGRVTAVKVIQRPKLTAIITVYG